MPYAFLSTQVQMLTKSLGVQNNLDGALRLLAAARVRPVEESMH